MWKWLFGSNLVQKVDRLGTYAAALAYDFVLSLVPFLIVTFTLFSEFAPRQVDLALAYRDLLSGILPTEGGHESLRILNAVESTSHNGLATIGFVFAVYTSYNLMTQIVRTLLFIFDDPRRPSEWNWAVSLKSAGLLAIWMLLLFILSGCLVLAPMLESVLRQLGLESRYWALPWFAIRDLIMIAALFGAFLLTYRLVPVKPQRWRLLRDGSLVATLGWMICSLLFSTILPGMWKLNPVFQALGSVVLVLLWAQACAWSVILGACWVVRFSGKRG